MIKLYLLVLVKKLLQSNAIANRDKMDKIKFEWIILLLHY